jgi:uncharacterized protein (TIGR03435 family)
MLKENCALAVLIVAQAAVAQTFEVASVKQAPPPSGGRQMVGMTGGPGSSDPARVRFSNVTLRNLVENAYGVAYYQVSGPEWTEELRYELIATPAKDTTKEQFHIMLQNLLAERFHLSIHREPKTMLLYSLTIAKGGPKLRKPVPDEPVPADTQAQSPAKITRDKDGYPELPRGTRMAIVSRPTGDLARLQGRNETMPSLVQMLSGQLGAPVQDDTGLIDKYDFTLSWLAQPPGTLPNNDANGPSIFSAVQEQLGLKLTARKGPVEIIVIDRADKLPVEN